MLPDYTSIRFPPSQRAAASLCLATKITDNSPWVSRCLSSLDPKYSLKALHTLLTSNLRLSSGERPPYLMSVEHWTRFSGSRVWFHGWRLYSCSFSQLVQKRKNFRSNIHVHFLLIIFIKIWLLLNRDMFAFFNLFSAWSANGWRFQLVGSCDHKILSTSPMRRRVWNSYFLMHFK